MGLITAAPGPDQVVTDAIKAELAAAGLRVSATGAGAVIRGELELFDVTVLDRDVLGTISPRLTAGHKGMRSAGHYDATCTERTYVWPTGDLMAHVLGLCVDDIGRQFHDETVVAHALSE